MPIAGGSGRRRALALRPQVRPLRMWVVALLILVPLLLVAAVVWFAVSDPAPLPAPQVLSTETSPSEPSPSDEPTPEVPAPEGAGPTALSGSLVIESLSALGAPFGAPAGRSVVVTVTNEGNTSASASVALRFGRDAASATSAGQLDLPVLEAGQSAVAEFPVRTGPLPFGSYEAIATISGSNITTTGELTGSTSAYPWGLILVLWLVLQVPLLGLHRRRPLSRSSMPSSQEPSGAAEAVPPPPAGYTMMPPR
jgi:hypothetical protein